MKTLRLHEIADCFGYRLTGDPMLNISHCSTDKDQSENALMWAKKPEFLENIKIGAVVTLEVLQDYIQPGVSAILVPDQLRYRFAQILQQFFEKKPDFINHADQHRDSGINLAESVFIAEDVRIGEGTIIEPNVTIHHNVTIGANCYIQSGAVIGSSGVGFEKLENKEWFRFPQIGGVQIGDHVVIGPNSTIRRAALGLTKIGEGTKIGGLCNVGHNVQIGSNCMLITGCVVGGSVIVEDDVYISISAVIRNKLTLGRGCLIGMGAVVVKDVASGQTVLGNPAKPRS